MAYQWAGGALMGFRQLSLSCAHCVGNTLIRLRRIGLTSQHQLVVHFWCGACKRNNYFVKALSDCWRECPKSEVELTVGELRTDNIMQEPDAQFLRSLGVGLPDERES
jgi:hypothetical protein